MLGSPLGGTHRSADRRRDGRRPARSGRVYDPIASCIERSAVARCARCYVRSHRGDLSGANRGLPTVPHRRSTTKGGCQAADQGRISGSRWHRRYPFARRRHSCIGTLTAVGEDDEMSPTTGQAGTPASLVGLIQGSSSLHVPEHRCRPDVGSCASRQVGRGCREASVASGTSS